MALPTATCWAGAEKSLMLYLDGKRTVFLWRTCPPGEACDQWSGGKAPSQIVHAGDVIQFEPAKAGKDQELNAGQLSRQLGVGGLACQGKLLAPDTPLSTGDSLETVQVSEKGPEKEKTAGAPIQIELNGRPLPLPGKADGTPLLFDGPAGAVRNRLQTCRAAGAAYSERCGLHLSAAAE